MRFVPALLMAVLLGAGCAQPAPDDVPDAAEPTRDEWPMPTQALSDCYAPAFAPFPCFEPDIASDAEGRIYVVTGKGDRLVVSEDGGATWQDRTVPEPGPGTPEGAGMGDAIVQADEGGRLWWSALVYKDNQLLSGLQVARSDDQGATWTASNHYFDLSRHPAGASFVDRQWLASWVGGAALLFWSVEIGSWISVSDDDGATWSDFRFALPVAMRANPNIPGSIARGPDGALYFGFAYGAGAFNEMRVARWTPEALVAEQFTVHAPVDDSYNLWPELVVHNGTLALAWAANSGALLVSTSQDGRSWSEPARWDGGEDAIRPPGLALRDGAAAVAWYSQGSAWWAVGADAMTPGPPRELATGLGTGRTTGFATVTAWPTGEAVAWIHPEAGVFVAVHNGAT